RRSSLTSRKLLCLILESQTLFFRSCNSGKALILITGGHILYFFCEVSQIVGRRSRDQPECWEHFLRQNLRVVFEELPVAELTGELLEHLRFSLEAFSWNEEEHMPRSHQSQLSRFL